MHPHVLAVAKVTLAALPGVALIAASSTLDWLDGLTTPEGLGAGAIVITIALLLYRLVIHAFNRADEIQKGIIDELRDENKRLIIECKMERELRMSLERAGVTDRRKPDPEG